MALWTSFTSAISTNDGTAFAADVKSHHASEAPLPLLDIDAALRPLGLTQKQSPSAKQQKKFTAQCNEPKHPHGAALVMLSQLRRLLQAIESDLFREERRKWDYWVNGHASGAPQIDPQKALGTARQAYDEMVDELDEYIEILSRRKPSDKQFLLGYIRLQHVLNELAAIVAARHWFLPVDAGVTALLTLRHDLGADTQTGLAQFHTKLQTYLAIQDSPALLATSSALNDSREKYFTTAGVPSRSATEQTDVTIALKAMQDANLTTAQTEWDKQVVAAEQARSYRFVTWLRRKSWLRTADVFNRWFGRVEERVNDLKNTRDAVIRDAQAKLADMKTKAGELTALHNNQKKDIEKKQLLWTLVDSLSKEVVDTATIDAAVTSVDHFARKGDTAILVQLRREIIGLLVGSARTRIITSPVNNAEGSTPWAVQFWEFWAKLAASNVTGTKTLVGELEAEIKVALDNVFDESKASDLLRFLAGLTQQADLPASIKQYVLDRHGQFTRFQAALTLPPDSYGVKKYVDVSELPGKLGDPCILAIVVAYLTALKPPIPPAMAAHANAFILAYKKALREQMHAYFGTHAQPEALKNLLSLLRLTDLSGEKDNPYLSILLALRENLIAEIAEKLNAIFPADAAYTEQQETEFYDYIHKLSLVWPEALMQLNCQRVKSQDVKWEFRISGHTVRKKGEVNFSATVSFASGESGEVECKPADESQDLHAAVMTCVARIDAAWLAKVTPEISAVATQLTVKNQCPQAGSEWKKLIDAVTARLKLLRSQNQPARADALERKFALQTEKFAKILLGNDELASLAKAAPEAVLKIWQRVLSAHQAIAACGPNRQAYVAIARKRVDYFTYHLLSPAIWPDFIARLTSGQLEQLNQIIMQLNLNSEAPVDAAVSAQVVKALKDFFSGKAVDTAKIDRLQRQIPYLSKRVSALQEQRNANASVIALTGGIVGYLVNLNNALPVDQNLLSDTFKARLAQALLPCLEKIAEALTAEVTELSQKAKTSAARAEKNPFDTQFKAVSDADELNYRRAETEAAAVQAAIVTLKGTNINYPALLATLPTSVLEQVGTVLPEYPLSQWSTLGVAHQLIKRAQQYDRERPTNVRDDSAWVRAITAREWACLQAVVKNQSPPADVIAWRRADDMLATLEPLCKMQVEDRISCLPGEQATELRAFLAMLAGREVTPALAAGAGVSAAKQVEPAAAPASVFGAPQADRFGHGPPAVAHLLHKGGALLRVSTAAAANDGKAAEAAPPSPPRLGGGVPRGGK